jgi:hypothetical protein
MMQRFAGWKGRTLFSFTPSHYAYTIIVWILLPIITLALALTFALRISTAYPSVKPNTAPLDIFSEERARSHFKNFTQFGPRVVNTESNLRARQFIIDQIQLLKNKQPNQNIRVESHVQYFTNFQRAFSKLANVIVRLSDASIPISQINNTASLLVSSHFDSVEFSPGGSDDGTGTVVMLEILQNLLHGQVPKYPIIFNFNDGEESGLLGADAFINQHEWAPLIKRFVNFDSTGGPGKAILFRARPSQIVLDYDVPHPHANIMGDEVMKVIPSDTDFTKYANRTFGFDFAFYMDGFNYHTSLDSENVIDHGALQHLGDNSLKLIISIANSEQQMLKNSTLDEHDENYVYYDVFGLFMMCYKRVYSDVLQVILIMFIAFFIPIVLFVDHSIMFRSHTGKDTIISLVFRSVLVIYFYASYISSIVLGVLYTLLVAAILSAIQPLSWYGKTALAVTVYVLPCLFAMIFVQWVVHIALSQIMKIIRKRSELPIFRLDMHKAYDTERNFGLLLVWMTMMIIVIASRIRSLYILVMWSVFTTITISIVILIERGIKWFFLIRKKRYMSFEEEEMDQDLSSEETEIEMDDERTEAELTRTTDAVDTAANTAATTKLAVFNKLLLNDRVYWAFVPTIAAIVPFGLSLELVSRLSRLMIPIMGRIGYTMIPQDVLVAALVSLIGSISIVTFIPAMHRALNFGKALIIIGIAAFVAFLVACFTTPFSVNAPKRVAVMHRSVKNFQASANTSAIVMSSNSSNVSVTFYDMLNMNKEFVLLRSAGYPVNQVVCGTRGCNFEDTRPSGINQVSILESHMITDTKYNVTLLIKHEPSFSIDIQSVAYKENTFALDLSDSNYENALYAYDRVGGLYKYGMWSSETKFSLQVEGNTGVAVNVRRCDLKDSPFLVKLQEVDPYVKGYGYGTCRLITDSVVVYFK